MAKLAKESYPLECVSGSNPEEYQRVRKELKKAESEATEENLVGFITRFSIADGYAEYRVIKDEGENDIILQHINTGDAWEVSDSLIKSVKRKDLIRNLNFDRTFLKPKVQSIQTESATQYKTKDGKIHTFLKSKGVIGTTELVQLVDENGKKHDKYLRNLTLV